MFDRFSHIEIFVNNMERALKWYSEKLGLKVNFAVDGGYASLEGYGIRIDLHPSEKDSKDVGIGPVAHFGAKNFDKACEELKSRGVKTSEVKAAGDSPRLLTFWDSEGNALGLEEVY